MNKILGFLIGFGFGGLLIWAAETTVVNPLPQSVTYSSVTNALVLDGNPSKFLSGDGTLRVPSAGGAMVGTVSNNVAVSGLLAVDAAKTNGIAATEAHVTNALQMHLSGLLAEKATTTALSTATNNSYASAQAYANSLTNTVVSMATNNSKAYADATFSGKTGTIELYNPEYVDGTGCTKVANGELTGRATFSGTAAVGDNWAYYTKVAPLDLDTSQDLTIGVMISVLLGNPDTAAQAYTISVYDAPASGIDLGTFGNGVTVNVAADASGALADTEYTTNVTLTGWKSAITPGHQIVVQLARQGNTDASTAATIISAIVLTYKKL